MNLIRLESDSRIGYSNISHNSRVKLLNRKLDDVSKLRVEIRVLVELIGQEAHRDFRSTKGKY